MKLKLLILSDLWGFDNLPWIKNYEELLKSDFQLIFYDSCELAGIDKTDLTEKELHSQFINGGINIAVNKLLQLENEEVNVIAFSIGGTIAWKAANNGLKINKLYAVSSTRLRYETQRPDCHIQLVFGEKDQFIPEQIWFKKLNLESEIIKNEQHEIYKKEHIAQRLCDRIKTHHNIV
jgi:hypothetical protein